MQSLLSRPVAVSERRLVTSRLLDTVVRRSHDAALRWRVQGSWSEMTWSEYAEQAAALATSLLALGVRPGERVGLLLRNRPEFHVADLGALLARAVPVSFYETSPPDRLAYLAGHCGVTFAVVDDPSDFERFESLRARLPSIRGIAVVEDPPKGAVAFSELLDAPPTDLEAAIAAVQPSDLATIVYTSGTTGTPKGAMITHANVAAAVDGVVDALGHHVAGWEMVSALPMAHVAERVASHYLHMAEGTLVTTCPDVALLPKYLSDVRPRAFFAVPRLWEKASALIRALAELDLANKVSFYEALAVGAEAATANDASSSDAALRAEAADRVLAPVRALIGLDRCEVAVSTAAPISPDVLEFFRALGVPISEVYGLSEATGPLTWDPRHPVPGDVGRPLLGTEVRIAPDGEVLARGPTVFAGYLHDARATAEALDDDGWLHTGDLGILENGRLRVVGRLKELVVTAGGENVAPDAIESLLRAHPLVSEAFVAGDRRPYLVALLTLDADSVRGFLASKGIVLDASDPTAASAVHHELVAAELHRWVAETNENLSRVEQVKRFAVLDHDWVADSDELTPTMKVKRRVVLEKFADEIARMYR
jgi:long-chain acyl-CoA synthetase